MPPFFVSKMVDFWIGVTRGVTERGYTFCGEGLQKWVLRVRTGEGYKYNNFNFNTEFCPDTPTLKTTSFATCPFVKACKKGNLGGSCDVREGAPNGGGQFRGGKVVRFEYVWGIIIPVLLRQ